MGYTLPFARRLEFSRRGEALELTRFDELRLEKSALAALKLNPERHLLLNEWLACCIEGDEAEESRGSWHPFKSTASAGEGTATSGAAPTIRVPTPSGTFQDLERRRESPQPVRRGALKGNGMEAPAPVAKSPPPKAETCPSCDRVISNLGLCGCS